MIASKKGSIAADVAAALTGQAPRVQDGYLVSRRPRWVRVLRPFFHHELLPIPSGEVFHITSEVDTRFCWRDRLRVLFTGRMHTTVRVYTDTPAKPQSTVVAQYVPTPGT